MSGKVKKWQELSRKTVFEEYGRALQKVTFRLPNGKKEDYYVIVPRDEVVTILPITKDNQVVLAKQFRQGPKKVFIDTPGGRIKAGETPEQAAERELFEEVGYKGRIQFVTSINTEPESTKIVHCMVATECEKVGEPDSGKAEFIEVVLMSLGDFRQHLKNGNMLDTAQVYLGLDFLGFLGAD